MRMKSRNGGKKESNNGKVLDQTAIVRGAIGFFGAGRRYGALLAEPLKSVPVARRVLHESPPIIVAGRFAVDSQVSKNLHPRSKL